MFENPFSFEGRIRRKEYWLSVVIYDLGLCIMGGFCVAMSNVVGEGIAICLIIVCYLVATWFWIAQSAKRCHDKNHSGWWQIIPFYYLWMLFSEGDAGENDYGPDPKDDDD